MSVIIAAIIAGFIAFGTAIPHYANNTWEDSLKSVFKKPEKIETRVYSTPSYRILNGGYDRIEIEVIDTEVGGLDVASLQIVATGLRLTEKDLPTKDLSFIKEGEVATKVKISPESIAEFVDLDSLKTRANNFLSNFEIPIPLPILSGNVSVDNLKLLIKSGGPVLEGNLIALGGFISLPFTFSGELIVEKNELLLKKPQLTINGQPLLFEKVQELAGFVNPVYEFKKLNQENMTVEVNSLKFQDDFVNLTANLKFRKK